MIANEFAKGITKMLKRELINKGKQVKLTFVQPHDGTKANVSVVGDFNNWDPNANKLVKRTNGTASTSVTLDAGRKIHFRYHTADGVWFNDEAADAYEAGDAGEDNSVVTL